MQTHTPSTLKWLLNERAALSGQFLRLEAAGSRLGYRQARLEAELQACLAQADHVRLKRTDVAARIACLDHTMQLLESRLEPASAGTVHAWQGRYGARGGKKRFIEDALKSVFPAALPSPVLVTLVIEAFKLTFFDQKERESYRRNMVVRLRRMAAAGQIERIRRPGNVGSGHWRWKAPSTRTLVEIQARVVAAAPPVGDSGGTSP